MLVLTLIRNPEKPDTGYPKEIQGKDASGNLHRLLEIKGIFFYQGLMAFSDLSVPSLHARSKKAATL
jgi:hypothetical protein